MVYFGKNSGDETMQLKPIILRIHRWIALLFSLPIIVVVVTGLVLSFEPLLQRALLERSLTKEDMLGYLQKYDPEGKATGLSIRTYEQSLTIAGAGPDGEIEIDLATGEIAEDDGSWSISEIMRTSRRMHEHLLLNWSWVVTASTYAMLALSIVGIVMGWPRLRNSLGGWHTVSAWSILPLAFLVPLTGLAIVYGVSFTTPAAGPRPERVSIKEAVTVIGENHDLAHLTSLRVRGGRLLARIYVGNVLTGFTVSKQGLSTTQMNWPRALHEGNWHAIWGSALNIIASVVFIGLWVTGLWIWARRKLRPRQRQRQGAAPIAAPAE